MSNSGDHGRKGTVVLRKGMQKETEGDKYFEKLKDTPQSNLVQISV